jgi:hypothetical protein
MTMATATPATLDMRGKTISAFAWCRRGDFTLKDTNTTAIFPPVAGCGAGGTDNPSPALLRSKVPRQGVAQLPDDSPRDTK